ncbi:hypothetical protein [Paludibacter jiangxiensis]|uniref:Uncharacterized protein n=1 Tax=Paludibacter jiangxiensis TaxID=681398 RepID=A0A171AW11_9BACT|nr:hypothetical protein [Paludibacter jiangxiensis]GAT64356.1 hypothetical protein PJIAN_4907 [Paludibacter jiangxiensis]
MDTRILLYKNDTAINDITVRCSTSIGTLQQICSELQTLGCTIDVNKILNTINRTHYNTDQYTTGEIADNIRLLVIELMGETPTIGGLSLSKNKLKDIIEIPNFDTILSLVKQLPQPITTIKPYLVVTTGNIALKPDYKQLIETAYSRYAETQKQIDLYNFLTNTKDALNAHIEKLSYSGSFLPELAGLKPNHHAKRYEVDGQFVMNKCK